MLHRAADAQLDRLRAVTPADGDELRLVYREQGWMETLEYFARSGMLTPAGEAEAAKLIAASGEWVDTLTAEELDDLVVPTVVVTTGPE